MFEHKLARIGKIKNRADNRNGEDEDEDRLSERPVIDLQVCLGGAMKTIEVNLTDRSAFNYPFLMGTRACANSTSRSILRALRRRQAHLQVSVLRHRRRD